MDISQINSLLLPNKFKMIGIALLFLGIFCAITCFYFGIKPAFLDIQVFAFYSRYFKANYFSIIQNNVIEELTALFLTVGLLFIILSKEKNENNLTMLLRTKAFLLSIYANSLLMIISIFFIYGLGFIFIIVLNLVSFQLFYILIFYIQIFRNRKNL